RESFRPPLDRSRIPHAQARARDGVRPALLRGHIPVEEGEVGSRAAHAARIEELVRADFVLIHAALDQPHSQRLDLSTVGVTDSRRTRGQVMESLQFHRFSSKSWKSAL